MSGADKNMNQYSASDIQKYLEGKLSAAEMHKMEDDALSDPFLADAMMGMELYSAENDFEAYKKDIAGLHDRLKQKTGTGKARIMVVWKIAAVLLVLVTSIALVYFFTVENVSKSKTLAKKEEKIPNISLPEDTSGAAGENSEKDLTSQNKAKQEEYAPAEKDLPGARTTISDSNKGSGKKDIPAAGVMERTPSPSVISPEKRSGLDSQRSAAQLSSVPARREIELSRAPEGKVAGVEIQNDSNAADEEVVISGYSAKKRRSFNAELDKIDNRTKRRFAPKTGWENFMLYVEQHKMDSVPVFLKGREIAEFDINDDERPGNIRIIQSLSPAHDSAIIRLLEKGPGWEVLKGRQRKLKLVIEY